MAHLLSPAEDRLRPELKALLACIEVRSGPLQGAEAEKAFQDCLRRIEMRALEEESRAINLRLGACANPEEERALLEAKQQMLRRRRVS
jgi:hypothetical protein